MADLSREDADDDNYFVVCNVVIEATLKSFPKLCTKTLKSLKSENITGPAAIKIVPVNSDPYFPPIGGRLELDRFESSNNHFQDTNSSIFSFNHVFNHERELNVVAEPRRIIVSTSSWRASMQILGKEYEQVTIAQMDQNSSDTPVWNVSREFVCILNKLANPDLYNICGGITKVELAECGVKTTDKQLMKRSYPGGAPRFESDTCQGVFEIDTRKQHFRCQECRHWLKSKQISFKRMRKINGKKSKQSSDSDCTVKPASNQLMTPEELEAELKRRTELLREHVIKVKRSIEI